MKSTRKYIVNAFTKIAERWEDSKTTPDNLRKHGFKNARQWGRWVASMYSLEGIFDLPDSIIEMYEFAAERDTPVTQGDFDAWAEEEVSCW